MVAVVADRQVGWVFVGAQVVLLVTLVVLPERDDWPTPGWVEAVGVGLVVIGVVVVAAASLRLGAALTPTPVPRSGAALATGGWYGIVRHPIYSGVLLVVAGLVVGSGSLVALVVGIVTWLFFHLKASWEERRLRAVHPGYDAYADRTPRFVPSVRRRRHG